MVNTKFYLAVFTSSHRSRQIKKIRKTKSVQCFADFLEKRRIFLTLNQYQEKSGQKTTRYHVFCSGRHLIQSVYMHSCLAAQKRFLLFKGLLKLFLSAEI